uniref:Tryptophan decarboxylase n=1 Tax=Solanum tuberosum TaxID=4113 RepID=M1D9M3_SOLTU
MSYYFNQHEYENLGVDYIRKFVVYGSDQTYSTHSKAYKIAGIFPCNSRVVPTSIESDFALSPVVLRGIIEVDVAAGVVPFFLYATVGTTSTTTVDPLSQLTEFNIWLHVDAAYGGSTCICPEFRQYLDGI